ncbi:MAG: hypothetical protein ACKO3W_12970, partial [bacterium]
MPAWNSVILGLVGCAIFGGGAFALPSNLLHADLLHADARANLVEGGLASTNPLCAAVEASQSNPPERMVLRVASSQSRIPVRLRPTVAAIDVDADRLAVLSRAGGGVLENVPLGPFREASLLLSPLSAFEGSTLIEVASTS